MKRIPKSLKISNGRNVKELNDIVSLLTGKPTYKDLKFANKLNESTIKLIGEFVGLKQGDKVLDKGKINPSVLKKLNEKILEEKYKQPSEINRVQKSIIELANKGILDKKIIGKTAEDGIKEFQKSRGLSETGKMDALTEEKLEEVLEATKGKLIIRQISEVFNPKNKSSVGNLHQILLALNIGVGLVKNDEEIEKREVGVNTLRTLIVFQKNHQLKEDIIIDEETAKELNKKLDEIYNIENVKITIDPIDNSIDFESGKNIANLHKILLELNLGLEKEEPEVLSGKIGAKTIAAIKKFQKENGIKELSWISEDVIAKLNQKLNVIINAANIKLSISPVKTPFDTTDKAIVNNLHKLLVELDLGLKENEEEVLKGKFGNRTIHSIRTFQEKNNLKKIGDISQETIQKLNEELVKQRYSKTENIVGLQENISLLVKKNFISISKIVEIEKKTELEQVNSTDERKQTKLKFIEDYLSDFKKEKSSTTIGKTTSLFTKYFQDKYKLSSSGKVDARTEKKMESVSSSIRGSKAHAKKQLKITNAKQLNRVVGKLRLNMTGTKVADLQKSLSWMGYKIAKIEYDGQRFGKTTRDAVLQFQKDNNLVHTGDTLNRATVDSINAKVGVANPNILFKNYRVRGSLRDNLWQPLKGATIQVFEKKLRGNDILLSEQKTFGNGFYDVVYAPPIDPVTQKPIRPLNLVVKAIDKNGNILHEKSVNKVRRIFWVNFTEGEDFYKGDSEFSRYMKLLKQPMAEVGVAIEELEQSDTHQDISILAAKANISPRDVLLVSLAHRVNNDLNNGDITPAIVYAFLKQNQPPELPSDLFPDKPEEWNDWILGLVNTVSNGIAFLDDDLQKTVIENAFSNNYIPRSLKPQENTTLQAFKTVRQASVLTKPILIGNGNLQTLLDESSINPNKYNDVANALIKHEGINEPFYENLVADAQLTAAEVIELRMIADLGVITRNHPHTLQVLNGIINDANQVSYNYSRDFARLSQAEWVDIINNSGGVVPANIDGNTNQEKINFFAATMKSQAERLFPSVAFVSEVARNNGHLLNHTSSVATFVYNHPDFDLRRDNLEKVNNGVLSDVELAEAKVIQRVHKIAPSSKAGVELLNERLHSSPQIYFYGKDRLVGLLQAKNVKTIEINKVFLKAEQRYAQILAAIARYRYELQRDTPVSVPQFFYSEAEVQQFKNDIPNIESLFGSLDYCECEHCSSLYSPAAYLTDLLRFLGEKDAVQNGNTVQDVLFNRRPDLKNIKLNCENTHTPLPYIDLINEILENVIPPVQSNFSYQTTLSQEELIAFPEHVRYGAYEKLRITKFPMKPVFNLWQEESRMFLKHLGVPRYRLMETFQNKLSTPQKPSLITIAGEYFGISSEELSIIAPSPSFSDATPAKQQEYWGTNNVVLDKLNVKQFLERSCISYNELLTLLQAKFVNPDINKSLIERPVDNCDVEQQIINNISIPKLDKMHRFIRLWRNCAWEIWELDLLIRKIGGNNLDENCLIQLWRFNQIQNELNISTEELISFFDNINTEFRIKPDSSAKVIDPLYNRLFLNKAISNPIDSGFEVVNLPGNISSHIPNLLSALTISQNDLDLLLPLTDGSLSLNTLSVLHRYALLAKKLRLSIVNLLRLLSITGINNPFLSLDELRKLLEKNQAIKNAGTNALELEYILSHVSDSPLGLREETITQFVENLRLNLSTIKSEILESTETKRELLDKHLSKINVFIEEDKRSEALDLIEGTWSLAEEPERKTFINDNFSLFIPTSSSPLTILTTKNYFDGDELTSIEETDIQNRYDYVLQHLYKYVSNTQIIESISSAIGVSNQEAEVLLNKLKLTGSPDSLLSYLKNESLTNKNTDGEFLYQIDKATFPNIYKVFYLTHKISKLLNNLKINSDELEWFIDNYSNIGVMNLEDLPIENTMATIPFTQWNTWQKLLEFKSHFPEPEEVSFYEILKLGMDNTGSNADLTNKHLNILEKLSQLTKWDVAEVQNVSGNLGLRFDLTHSDYTKAETYHHIWNCFKLIKVIGIDAVSMFRWADKTPVLLDQKAIAKSTRNLAKSKHEQVAWLKVLQPIEDELREKKRNALINYLIEWSLRNESPEIAGEPNTRYWQNSRDLFNYFLIDVEMNACQLSSRIRQAISSVQLFIQRCFLNLESRFVQVPNSDPDLENNWEQWRWMKNYRIWEANRKVFFYPENWIEPELRDDKSPFFKELENEVLQNEITNKNVEQAFFNYIQKVDEVADLEIMSTYHDFHGEVEEVHVIGRTKSIPHIYFHRTYNLDYGHWTPWEKVEIEITGNHVIPVVYNRKLHLFWLVFDEKPEKVRKNPPAQPSSSPKDNQEPSRVLEIQLAWSVKKHNGWTPKVISNEKLIHPWERPHHSYHLKPRYKASDNTLWVDLFISTSEEFNSKLFYDQFSAIKKKRTRNPFNETFRPWHSSSFVFNGAITEIRLRGIQAPYYLPDSESVGNITSFNYVNKYFGVEGRKHKLLSVYSPDYSNRLLIPAGMHFQNNYLTNNTRNNRNTNKLNINNIGLGAATLLKQAKAPFKAVMPMLTPNRRPFIYQDEKKSFFVKAEWTYILQDYQTRVKQSQYIFYPFYHPYTTLFIRELNRSGLEGLLNRKIQVQPETFYPQNNFNFTNTYSPVSPHEPHETAQSEIVDFSFGGAYSIYNWEIFFHAPMLIAGKLSQNQRFEEAMNWYHYVFDPTNTENHPTPQRYWITKPFYEHTSTDYKDQRIQNIIDRIDEFSNQVAAWKNHPFKPHLIARYRPVAYQRNVVMKYIDNLIAWGDQLFRRDTMESINQASLLYVLSYELLGDRPISVPSIPRTDKTFEELQADNPLDIFGNNKIEALIENTLSLPIQVSPSTSGSEPLPRLEINYFCIPRNEKLTTYWDTVEDRLFKIRNCMNIEGIVRQLPLFAPPIDPALLVKAAAAGVDLGSVLNDLSVPSPHYRFRILLQAAVQFSNHVKSLGDQLLSVLEKKDAEKLSLLRASNEIKIQEAIKEVRKLQISEAEESLDGLKFTKSLSEKRKEFYEGREFMNTGEMASTVLNSLSIISHTAATVADILAGVMFLIPDFNLGASGFGGSPHVAAKTGGSNIGKSTERGANGLYNLATILDKSASLVSTIASYNRRQEEWDFQAEQATIEIDQIKKQIEAAKIRISIGEKELDNQKLIIENVKSEEEYLKNKYTNEQLYGWMVSQISSVYFQSYQLAYDMAKKAEKSFRKELGLKDSSYIQFGYWDSLKKGLLSGDKLLHDLNRMEAAYYEKNKRELELTKHVSLAQVAPWSLLQLKTSGECVLEIPEWLFDMDYPGHYMRRIKSVSISIPCIVGTYSGVHCSLSLNRSQVRTSNTVNGNYEWIPGTNDSNFHFEIGAIQSIATSHGQSDSGVFELNFNDERFLPFEGAGAVSSWGIKMPRENNHFDFSTISDVILHIQYTARNGGGNLELAARSNLDTKLPNEGVRLFSLKHEFPTEWHRFLHPDIPNSDQELKINLGIENYPFYTQGKTNLNVKGLKFVIDGKHNNSYNLQFQLPGQPTVSDLMISKNPAFGNTHVLEHALASTPMGRGEWNLKLRRDSDLTADNPDFSSLPKDNINDILMIVEFEVS